MYKKMFVLFIKSTNEYVITYNVEQVNINTIPENTILVHRKKESNTLYTINALNDLIKKLNNGEIDPTYKIEWQNYKNCVLLTQQGEVKQLNTKIYKIVDL
jgi:thymidylate synthase